jgi:hypothetical protein
MVDTDDSEAETRHRLEAMATTRIVEAQALADALELLEAAVHQVGRGALPAFAERAARLHSLAMARMRQQERQAVRDRLKGAR